MTTAIVCWAAPAATRHHLDVEPCPYLPVGSSRTKESMMAKQAKTLQDLFVDTLKDIYYAENKILKTLPKMAKPSV
jgi:Domain of unknown function (DUF892)